VKGRVVFLKILAGDGFSKISTLEPLTDLPFRAGFGHCAAGGTVGALQAAALRGTDCCKISTLEPLADLPFCVEAGIVGWAGLWAG
ncbi:MAG: hypothetical protein IJC43_07370, partial [Clostridia bacterium]|nr:hypothetical protein [Clostridia bacterium]